MKKIIFLLLFPVFCFLFSQQAYGACGSFSASVEDSWVTLTATNCDDDGTYLFQILDDSDSVILADNGYIVDGTGEIVFHLDDEGTYSAKLLFGYDILEEINFEIEPGSVVNLECGDPCSPNDLTCPAECPSRSTGSGWYCLEPSDSDPGQPTLSFGAPEGLYCPNNTDLNTAIGCIPRDLPTIIKRLFPFLLGLGGLVSFLLIVFSGIRILTSAGNPEVIKGAKETITSAITGLLFIILSLFLLRLIGVNILQLPGLL